jgi:1-acyl-sn-glycerol-3-phosphate acyltransferase
VVYISNHPSTLDLFLLVALGLPRTRFFLSGFLQKYVPIGVIARMMGTFFTVPQSDTAARRRIFAAASRTLHATGESVYLSPEGARVTGGRVGPFNKGAFHLAASLGAPIVPLLFVIPAETDPGVGYDVRPGTVHVHVGTPIVTRDWRIEDIASWRDAVHADFSAWQRTTLETHRAHDLEPGLIAGIAGAR